MNIWDIVVKELNYDSQLTCPHDLRGCQVVSYCSCYSFAEAENVLANEVLMLCDITIR